jgi:hypothetical protein
MTVLVCALCALSFTASGYFSYRETLLESRLGVLEAQLAGMRATYGGNGEVVLERLRREVEARFQQRINREMASGRRLLMDVAASSMQHARAPRNVPECGCPPGRETARSVNWMIFATLVSEQLASVRDGPGVFWCRHRHNALDG